MNDKNFTTNQKTINLAIKLNLNAESLSCPLCNKQTNPNVGAELTLAENSTAVCRDCGNDYAPVLTALLELSEAATNFFLVENEFGNRWQEDFVNENCKNV